MVKTFLCLMAFSLCLISNVLLSFSDRTCTVLNVEGDAFGAGLLQHFVDRTSKHEGAELSEVRFEGDLSAAGPEHSPLIEKRGGRDDAEGDKAALSRNKESVM